MRIRLILGICFWLGGGIVAGLTPAPYGIAIYFSLVSAYSIVYGLAIWHRTRLGFVASAHGFNAAFTGVAALLALRGVDPFDGPLQFLVPVVPWMLLALGCRWVARKRYPVRLAALESTWRGRSFWQSFALESVPNLRDLPEPRR